MTLLSFPSSPARAIEVRHTSDTWQARYKGTDAEEFMSPLCTSFADLLAWLEQTEARKAGIPLVDFYAKSRERGSGSERPKPDLEKYYDALAAQCNEKRKRDVVSEKRTAIYSGQVYREVGTKRHTRRDGSETELTVWESDCAQCGKPFSFKTPAESTKFQPNRRCQKCKRPGQRVRGEKS